MTPLPAAPLATRVAVLTFDGFDELDSFVAMGLINRLKADGLHAEIAGPTSRLTSMHGVTIEAQRPLEFANDADVVLFSGSLYSRAIAENSALLDRLRLDPIRQLIGAQGAGTLLLARLGLLADVPACTDPATKPWVVQAGVRVLDEPFHARGPVATAGGCMAAQYLATWVMVRRAGWVATQQMLRHVAPVGEAQQYADHLLRVVRPFVEGDAAGA